jgi:hypothetical protein
MDVRKEAKKRAREALELHKDDPEFLIADVRERLFVAFADLADGAMVGLVDWALDAVDREAAKDLPDDQPPLPGFDLDGISRLGGGRRVFKARSTMFQAQEAMLLKRKNRLAVERAFIRDEEEFLKLAPYWENERTKREAVEAYQRANPEG